MKKKVVPKLRQEMKVKADIVTSYDIKIYYTGKFQDFTARYIIKIRDNHRPEVGWLFPFIYLRYRLPSERCPQKTVSCYGDITRIQDETTDSSA